MWNTLTEALTHVFLLLHKRLLFFSFFQWNCKEKKQDLLCCFYLSGTLRLRIWNTEAFTHVFLLLHVRLLGSFNGIVTM